MRILLLPQPTRLVALLNVLFGASLLVAPHWAYRGMLYDLSPYLFYMYASWFIVHGFLFYFERGFIRLLLGLKQNYLHAAFPILFHVTYNIVDILLLNQNLRVLPTVVLYLIIIILLVTLEINRIWDDDRHE